MRIPLQSPNSATIRERRTSVDRRQASMRALVNSLYRGRRQAPRRANGYGTGLYIDVIRPHFAVATVVILLLSCADCVNTLLLLDRGARELNPVMHALIEADTTLFVAAKLALTAVCVLFIVAHRHFRFFRLRGSDVLYGVLAMYLGLVAYQLTLLAW